GIRFPVNAPLELVGERKLAGRTHPTGGANSRNPSSRDGEGDASSRMWAIRLRYLALLIVLGVLAACQTTGPETAAASHQLATGGADTNVRGPVAGTLTYESVGEDG